MNQSQVKNKVYEVVTLFFSQATVVWAEQVMTKPPVPYVTLKMGSITKVAFPCINEVTGDRHYGCRTLLELNLYTKGVSVTAGIGVTGNYENTATDDLMEFIKFLESPEIVDILEDIGLELNPPVRDLSELLNDAKYRYRAMAECTISYTEEACGLYGVSNMPQIPNSSGGGSKEIAIETPCFDTAEIEEEKDGNYN